MRRKIKLISTFASLMLVFVIMAYSVWAAQSINVSITNSVTYTVEGEVYALISATTAAGDNTTIISGGDPLSVELLGNETEGSSTLDIGNVELDALSTMSGQTIIFSYIITIQNNAESGIDYDNLTVTFSTVPTTKVYESESYGITVAFGGTVVSPAATAVLAPGETLTMTVTFEGDARCSHDTTATTILNSAVSLVATASVPD